MLITVWAKGSMHFLPTNSIIGANSCSVRAQACEGGEYLETGFESSNFL